MGTESEKKKQKTKCLWRERILLYTFAGKERERARRPYEMYESMASVKGHISYVHSHSFVSRTAYRLTAGALHISDEIVHASTVRDIENYIVSTYIPWHSGQRVYSEYSLCDAMTLH